MTGGISVLCALYIIALSSYFQSSVYSFIQNKKNVYHLFYVISPEIDPLTLKLLTFIMAVVY